MTRTNRRLSGPVTAPLALVALAVTLCVASPGHALPVLPGAAGFGVDTPAGRGGTVFRVNNLNADGAGSLKACIDASGPRVCVFETSGVINLGQDLAIRNPYITIAGQTAPSPGIMLRGAGLRISASHVLVQHLRVRVGDALQGPDPGNRDALKIESSAGAPISHVVVDHCSFSWSVDEMASIWEGASNVSLLNNIFAEPLHDSIHTDDGSPPAPHGYGIIFGPRSGGVGNISMVGNLLAHQVSRNPLATASFVMVNNLVYDRGDIEVEFGNRGQPISASVVGNVFLRGPSSTGTRQPVFVRGGTSVNLVVAGSKLYLADNRVGSSLPSDPWSLALVDAPVNRSSLISSSAPLWPSGLVARSTAGGAVQSSVLANAGARPADRDAVDARVVSDVRNGAGQIINCVAPDGSSRCAKNGGGWPPIPQRLRALSLPSNHEQVGADGYTVLETWLQRLAAEVEGGGEVPTPPADTQLL